MFADKEKIEIQKTKGAFLKEYDRGQAARMYDLTSKSLYYSIKPLVLQLLMPYQLHLSRI